MSKGFLEFDGVKPEKVRILPVGRKTCLMCEKDTDNNRLIQMTKRFKVRLCPKCWKDYERVVGTWREVCKFRKI